MKAFVHTRYGGPDVLSITDRLKPTPKTNEVLIKVYATTVNRTDTGFRQPAYLIVRLVGGLFRPKNTILGSELAGIVEQIGAEVTTFKPGDRVFGLSTYRFGAHAEYICVNEKIAITQMPVNMSFNEAAAICDGAFLAFNYIGKIDFRKKPKILINGADGSIGSAAVQLARHFGAHITAVCRGKNIDLIKSLGAHRVIDYEREDFTSINDQFDTVLDAVGKSSYFKCRKILTHDGNYYSTELGFLSQNVFLALFTPIFCRKKVLFPIPKDRKEDIEFFRKLIENNEYRAVIDRIYPFEQTAEAHRYVDTAMKTGNVVIQVVE